MRFHDCFGDLFEDVHEEYFSCVFITFLDASDWLDYSLGGRIFFEESIFLPNFVSKMASDNKLLEAEERYQPDTRVRNPEARSTTTVMIQTHSSDTVMAVGEIVPPPDVSVSGNAKVGMLSVQM